MTRSVRIYDRSEFDAAKMVELYPEYKSLHGRWSPNMNNTSLFMFITQKFTTVMTKYA